MAAVNMDICLTRSVKFSHLSRFNSIFNVFRDLGCLQAGFDWRDLRVSPWLDLGGELLVAGFSGSPSAPRDAHGPPEESRDDGAKATLHSRRAPSAGQGSTIGPSTGPSPARATVTCLGRQLFKLSPLFSLSFSFSLPPCREY